MKKYPVRVKSFSASLFMMLLGSLNYRYQLFSILILQFILHTFFPPFAAMLLWQKALTGSCLILAFSIIQKIFHPLFTDYRLSGFQAKDHSEWSQLNPMGEFTMGFFLSSLAAVFFIFIPIHFSQIFASSAINFAFNASILSLFCFGLSKTIFGIIQLTEKSDPSTYDDNQKVDANFSNCNVTFDRSSMLYQLTRGDETQLKLSSQQLNTLARKKNGILDELFNKQKYLNAETKNAYEKLFYFFEHATIALLALFSPTTMLFSFLALKVIVQKTFGGIATLNADLNYLEENKNQIHIALDTVKFDIIQNPIYQDRANCHLITRSIMSMIDPNPYHLRLVQLQDQAKKHLSKTAYKYFVEDIKPTKSRSVFDMPGVHLLRNLYLSICRMLRSVALLPLGSNSAALTSSSMRKVPRAIIGKTTTTKYFAPKNPKKNITIKV